MSLTSQEKALLEDIAKYPQSYAPFCGMIYNSLGAGATDQDIEKAFKTALQIRLKGLELLK